MTSNGVGKELWKALLWKKFQCLEDKYEVDITAVVCMIFLAFVFSKISSMNMYCLCDQEKNSLNHFIQITL